MLQAHWAPSSRSQSPNPSAHLILVRFLEILCLQEHNWNYNPQPLNECKGVLASWDFARKIYVDTLQNEE